MPYLSSENVARIRAELKASFPEIKFSITRDGHSGVRVKILESPYWADGVNESVNTFYIKDRKEYPEILKEIHSIMANGQRELVYDGDYGSVPTFYTWMEIGDSYVKPHKKTIIMNLNQAAIKAYNKRMARAAELAKEAEVKKAQEDLDMAVHMLGLYPDDQYYMEKKSQAEKVLGIELVDMWPDTVIPVEPAPVENFLRSRDELLEMARASNPFSAALRAV